MIAILNDRRVLRLAGDDVHAFLSGLVTNDLAKLTPETPIWAALLSAQGKYLADMFLFDGGNETVLIDVHADRADDLYKRLRMYRLRRPIEIEPADLKVFAAWDEASLPHPPDPRTPLMGQRWLAEGSDTTASTADWHLHRLKLGIPDSPDFEVDKLMWLESNADHLNGVSFTKGCYVGQENTARMNYRGKVRKRMLPVTLGDDPGDERRIMAGDREAGTLMSHIGDKGIAHIRLEHADAPMTLGDASVTINWPSWLPQE